MSSLWCFGEALVDQFAGGECVPGGAPFNVAWHLHGFGLRPTLVTRLGCDDNGDRIREAMRAWGLAMDGVQADAARPTGRVHVELRDGEPAYRIDAPSAYDAITAPGGDGPDVLYHGTLALRSHTSRRTCRALCGTAGVQRFVDVNLRAPFWERGQVLASLEGARWVKCSQTELSALMAEDAPTDTAIQRFRQRLGVAELLVTQGEHGARLYGESAGPLAIAPDEAVIVEDTVGAGDAFAAAFLAHALRGLPAESCLARAQAFASRIVALRGAVAMQPSLYTLG